MLRRASVRDIKRDNAFRKKNYTIVVMLYYPRFLSRKYVDEYIHALAPPRELFTEFKKLDRLSHDHEYAFRKSHYERRFQISEEGVDQLARIAEMAKVKNVCLLCQCATSEACHTDLLLLLARKMGFPVMIPEISYPIFQRRIKTLSKINA